MTTRGAAARVEDDDNDGTVVAEEARTPPRGVGNATRRAVPPRWTLLRETGELRASSRLVPNLETREWWTPCNQCKREHGMWTSIDFGNGRELQITHTPAPCAFCDRAVCQDCLDIVEARCFGAPSSVLGEGCGCPMCPEARQALAEWTAGQVGLGE